MGPEYNPYIPWWQNLLVQGAFAAVIGWILNSARPKSAPPVPADRDSILAAIKKYGKVRPLDAEADKVCQMLVAEGLATKYGRYYKFLASAETK